MYELAVGSTCSRETVSGSDHTLILELSCAWV